MAKRKTTTAPAIRTEMGTTLDGETIRQYPEPKTARYLTTDLGPDNLEGVTTEFQR